MADTANELFEKIGTPKAYLCRTLSVKITDSNGASLTLKAGPFPPGTKFQDRAMEETFEGMRRQYASLFDLAEDDVEWSEANGSESDDND